MLCVGTYTWFHKNIGTIGANEFLINSSGVNQAYNYWVNVE